MRNLTPNSLLSVWDAGVRLHPLDRALLVLEAAMPHLSWGALAATPVVQRDIWLLEAREKTFGSRLAGYTECPACGERLEFSVDTRALHLSAELDFNTIRSLGGSADGITIRLPNSLDLASVADCPDAEFARAALLQRVIVSGHENINAETLDAIFSAIDQWSEVADFTFELVCAACGHGWVTLLDIGAYFWIEIERGAKRLMREVDALARVYGWNETEILSLSPIRRAAYVQMALS